MNLVLNTMGLVVVLGGARLFNFNMTKPQQCCPGHILNRKGGPCIGKFQTTLAARSSGKISPVAACMNTTRTNFLRYLIIYFLFTIISFTLLLHIISSDIMVYSGGVPRPLRHEGNTIRAGP